jgi:DNA-binding CsgD family transcriptional regulator/PAS domain-containing protein
MSDGRLLALTEVIYDAAAGGTTWSAVGQSLRGLIGAHSEALMVGDLKTDRVKVLSYAEIPAQAIAAYRDHYRTVDLWTNRAAEAAAMHGRAAPPKVWTSGHLVPDTEFLRSEFYVDFGRRLGLRYVVGTVLPLGAAGMMPIGFHRPEGAEPFTETDSRLLECLLPHLRRALQIHHQLNSTSSSVSPGAAALDALSLGVLVVDEELRVLVANAAAEAMAARAAGVRLVAGASSGTRGKTVVAATYHAENVALHALVRATALNGSPGGAVRLSNATGSSAVAALVAPLPHRLYDTSTEAVGRMPGQALVLLRDLASSPNPPKVELLRVLFGLTTAEAEVARALCRGATKTAVATMRGLQVSTVRTQVRAILQKTGAANLRDLENLLGRLDPFEVASHREN